MTYEELIIESNVSDIYELDMQLKGLYADGVIGISKHISGTEKSCILAEELGHYHTSVGNILDQSNIENRKQERRARAWGYEKKMPLIKIIEAYKARCVCRDDLIEFLNVTDEYLNEALDYYRQKHGLYYQVDNYVIILDPLVVIDKF